MDTNAFHQGGSLPLAYQSLREVERSLALNAKTLKAPHLTDTQRARLTRERDVLLDRWLLIEKVQRG